MIKKITPFNLLLILGGIILFGVGFFVGSFFSNQKYQSFLDSISLNRENDVTYPLVHPILGFNSENALSVNQFGPLAKKIQDIFTTNKSSISRYSVYFRDQNKGFWVGINEDDTFSPASMSKVVLAIAIYKQAESDPEFLRTHKIYTPQLAKMNTDISFSLPSELKVGQSYEVVDLVSKMIIDSDNGAKDILGSIIDPKILDDLFTRLGMDIPKAGQGYVVSTKKYTSFFKSLYSATYLNKDYSNRLLTLLSRATFNKGLVAGIPSTVAVSHKYGEYVNDGNATTNSVELHDCGIVYEPENPYILCVMTQGKSEDDLARIIADVSKVVYNEVSNNYK
jgi:beta-lactamase class A